MRAVKSKVTRALPVGAFLKVADNSGAKLVQVTSVARYGGVKRRLQCAGVGDRVTVVVKEGKPDIKHKVVSAVVVRQKQAYKRPSGERIKFNDNAVVILKDPKEGEPKGTFIRGPIAKEVAIRWPHINKIASIVV